MDHSRRCLKVVVVGGAVEPLRRSAQQLCGSVSRLEIDIVNEASNFLPKTG
jgi:hypothetical protein